jgi:hypothetical protein
MPQFPEAQLPEMVSAWVVGIADAAGAEAAGAGGVVPGGGGGVSSDASDEYDAVITPDD